MDELPIQLTPAATEAHWQGVRELFREYAHYLGVDLCFQGFESELQNLPGEYAPPRGTTLLATVDDELAGCCGLRPIDNVDYPNAAEMKRLYVRKAFRGFGLGRMLTAVSYTHLTLPTNREV